MKKDILKIAGSCFIISAVCCFIALNLITGNKTLWAHEWKAPKEAANRINPMEKSTVSINNGKELYLRYCSNCHGSDGTGDGLLSYTLKTTPPNLMERAGHHSDGDFAWKIANGRGEMPAFRSKLSEDQIWDITNFLKAGEQIK